jgi:hypothetical protein
MGASEWISLMAAKEIASTFPKLVGSGYRITSADSTNYNCVAWAAHDTSKPWWPTHLTGYFWPRGIKKTCTVKNFLAAFRRFGFELCENAEWESGFEKVALYVDQAGEPTHMARQLDSGKWTSKLGDGEDIEHNDLAGLEGNYYGTVAQILKKPVRSAVQNE